MKALLSIFLLSFTLFPPATLAQDTQYQLCKKLGEAIALNLERTKNRGGSVTVGGGKTIPYSKSEKRLEECLKGVCKDSSDPAECYDLLSSKEDAIAAWFSKYPEEDFAKSVCGDLKKNNKKPPKSSGSSKGTKEGSGCKCPFAKWCPCRSSCEGGKCCFSSLKQCSLNWLGRAKDATYDYSQKAAQKASEYSRMANSHLSKLPVDRVTDRLPLSHKNRRFVRDNWKAIVLTLALLIVTPLYYFTCCRRQEALAGRSGARSGRRHGHRN